MAAFTIELGKAKGLLKKLGFSVAKADAKKVTKFLKSLPEKDDLDDDDLDKKDQRIMDDVAEAVAKNRKIVVSEDEEEEEEEDEKPSKKGKGKKEAKGKKGKKSGKEKAEKNGKAEKKSKKKKSNGGGGPSNKDKVFELWLKSTNPGKDAGKWIKKFPDISGTTIRGWISNWKKGLEDASYPRAAQGRDKEIKKALKAQKE